MHTEIDHPSPVLVHNTRYYNFQYSFINISNLIDI